MEDIRLYHFHHPNGKMLSVLRTFKSDEELVAEGWTQDPKLATEPEKKIESPLTAEQTERARPEDLVGIVKGMGFNVLTDEQLEAEIVKATINGGQFDITTLPDAALCAEIDRRNGNASAAIVDSLADRFREDPLAMNKEDLVVYGKEAFGLKLKMTMKEETLINRINEAILEAQ